MNKQLIFDKVARHLLTQKRKSQDGLCLFRGPKWIKMRGGRVGGA